MTDLDQIRGDLMHLAGRLLHRTTQTEHERRAAEYLRGRLREHIHDVSMDDFAAIEGYPYLFASYYAEFLVVAVLALWAPLFAAVYGFAAFAAYLAEYFGYPVFSRLLPRYETQNVFARLLAPKPRHTFIITAHYDSGFASPLSAPGVLPWLRPAHFLVLACMVLVIATCGIDGYNSLYGIESALTGNLRWAAVGLLVSAAAFLFYVSTQEEDIRGANHNASGVAAMLLLAERLAKNPLEHADVWIAATGCHECWMAGMQHLLRSHKPDSAHTYLLNLEGVGAGNLHYLTAEGMLSLAPASKPMVRAAEAVAPQHNATPARLRAIPSAAHFPLHHGYPALTLMGLDQQNLPIDWNSIEDRVTTVDESQVLRATNLAEALLRQLEYNLPNER